MPGLFAAILATPRARQGPPADWKKIVLTPGVTISIPPGAKPFADNGKEEERLRTWEYTLRSFEKDEPGVAPDRVLAEYLAGALGELVKPRSKRQRDLTLNGWPGLEALVSGEIKAQGVVAMLTREYVVAGNLYSETVTYLPDAGRPPTTDAYLNSLQVLDAAKPGPQDSPGPTFVTITPKDQGYSIGMPSTPKEEDVPIGKGDSTSTDHRQQAIYGNRVYIANSIPFPKVAPDLTQGEKNEVLTGIVMEVVGSLEAKATAQPATVERGGLEFVRVDCSTSDGLVARAEATVSERRIFVTLMVYPSGHAGSPDIEAFFNSFKVLAPIPAHK